MSQETKSLPENEFVLRRIHKNHVDPGPPAVIGFTGFRPTSEDTAGLSVYRENQATAAEVAASGRKPGESYVVRLQVCRLHDLGLTVLADDLAEGPVGHALIPELSLDACQRDKAKLRAVQVRLAEFASQHIVHSPGGR